MRAPGPVLDVYGYLCEGIDEAAMEGLDRLRSADWTDTGAPEVTEPRRRIDENRVPVRDSQEVGVDGLEPPTSSL